MFNRSVRFAELASTRQPKQLGKAPRQFFSVRLLYKRESGETPIPEMTRQDDNTNQKMVFGVWLQ